MADFLTFDGVTAGYDESVVLEGVSFSLGEGESLALLGRNGVGKTTLLVTLMGFTRMHKGDIRWQGDSIVRMATHRRAQAGLGWVPQERFMFPSLTVEEHLTAVARPGPWNIKRVYEIFPRLEERRANLGNQLSGGEQQMLAIARALMMRPKMLLLDEPSFGIAPRVTQEIYELLHQLRESEHLTALIVEQNAQVALNLVNRAYVLESGRITAQGTAAELREDDAVRRSYLGH